MSPDSTDAKSFRKLQLDGTNEVASSKQTNKFPLFFKKLHLLVAKSFTIKNVENYRMFKNIHRLEHNIICEHLVNQDPRAAIKSHEMTVEMFLKERRFQ